MSFCCSTHTRQDINQPVRCRKDAEKGWRPTDFGSLQLMKLNAATSSLLLCPHLVTTVVSHKCNHEPVASFRACIVISASTQYMASEHTDSATFVLHALLKHIQQWRMWTLQSYSNTMEHARQCAPRMAAKLKVLF